MIKELSSEEVRELFRKIYNRERPHGEFLTAFAKAVVMADAANLTLLAPSAAALILKYKLDEEGEPEVISEGN